LAKRPRPKVKAPVLKRPTVDTRIYIDYDWWERSNLDLKTYLYSRLDIDEDLQLDTDMEKVDLVDQLTGEVHQVDGFQYVLQTYFSQLPQDFAARTSLVDAVFCVLLANANQPMAVREIAERLQRPPEVILRTLGGPQVYQGIRPLFDEDV
jgi:hypothetical protein